MRSLGPGFRFQPTNVELTMYYLKRKVMGRKFHHDRIQVLDVYDFAPWDLQGQALWKRDLKWYFFCPRERKYSTGGRMKRSTEHGSWRISGNDRPVHYKGEIVGKIKSLVFYRKNPKQSTNWVMHEYKLQDEYLKKLGLEEDAFVLCVIFEKEGPGPRNGAQYGGPYREEDWDNDGNFNINDDVADDKQDNHGEVTHGVGALADIHGFTDKGKGLVPNDRYYMASSSRTPKSHINQSVTDGFPPTPVPGTLPGDSQLPLSNDCGMFAHEVLSASLENEQAQDIDGVDRSFDCEPSFPIYNGSEDIFRLEDVSGPFDRSHVHGHAGPWQPSPLEDCMNVSGPFDGSHVHGHAGPGQPSPCFGPVISEGIPDETFVGQQNWRVGISDITPSWNGRHHEPAQTDRFINYPQTGSSWFTSSNFPDSGSSGLHTYLNLRPPVSEGFTMFSAQGFGEYGPFLQHPQFPDGFGGEDIGDNVPHLNQHHHLGGQGLEENVLYPYVEDIDRLDDVRDSCINAHDNDFLANQKIPWADYMELDDMEALEDCMHVPGPFKGSHVHDHVGPGQPSPCFGPVILEGIPNETRVGQQNWRVGISDITEPAQTDGINDPQTGSSWFTSSNFPDSGSSELHMPYLDPCPPVSEGSVMFGAQGIGEYGPFLRHPQFPDGFGGEDIGDIVNTDHMYKTFYSWRYLAT